MHPSSIFHLPNDLFFEIPTGNIIQTNKNTLFLLGFPPEVGMRKNRQLPTIKSNRNLKQTPEKKVADIDLSRKDQQQKASSFPCSPQKKTAMKCCVQKRLKPAKLFHSWLPHGFGLNTTPPPSPGFVGPQPRRQSYQNTHTSKPAQPTTHFFREKITIGSSDGLELRVFGFFTRNSQLHIKKKS